MKGRRWLRAQNKTKKWVTRSMWANRVEAVQLRQKLALMDNGLAQRLEELVLCHLENLVNPQDNSRKMTLGLIRLFRVAAILHALLIRGRTVALRDIYYIDPECFGFRQASSNQAVVALARALQVPRSRLPVLPAYNGLAAGSLEVDFGDRVLSALDYGRTGMFVPARLDRALQVSSRAQFVLVVEKETVFHHLLDQGFLAQHWPCLLVTGRGSLGSRDVWLENGN
mmetsp:Transcript_18022/g.37368  ORF Transcript_18022/g.37368 Transcript_18022/m.37368 type:complete len:226 (+) Transcript_18022:887-1564(+)